MKMEKLSSKEKSGINNSITQITDYGFARVCDWAKTELEKLRKDKLPICIVTDTKIVVGKCTIIKEENIWLVDNYIFFSKVNAIFYCVLIHLNRVNDADELYKLNNQIHLLSSKRNLFKIRLAQAYLDNNQFKIDVYNSRLLQAKDRLIQVKLKLEKIINQAKYYITN